MYGYGQTVVSLRDTRGEVTSTDVAMQHTMLRCDDRIDARYCRAATDAATDAADAPRSDAGRARRECLEEGWIGGTA